MKQRFQFGDSVQVNAVRVVRRVEDWAGDADKRDGGSGGHGAILLGVADVEGCLRRLAKLIERNPESFGMGFSLFDVAACNDDFEKCANAGAAAVPVPGALQWPDEWGPRGLQRFCLRGLAYA